MRVIWLAILPLLLLCLTADAGTARAQAADSAPATALKRDRERFEAKQREIVEVYRKQSPAAGAEIEKLFRSQDILAAVAPSFAKLGLNSEDIVDMTAAYWIVAWEASHGLAGVETDPRKTAAVRDQLGSAMRANPAVAKLDEKGRQELGDTMLLNALLTELRMRSAAKLGSAMRQRMSDQIAAEARATLSVDLRALEMTDTGFAAKAGGAPPATVSPSPPPPADAAPQPPPGVQPQSQGSGGGNAPNIAGLYFRAISSHSGGVDFEPLVFFANGEYLELGATPPEEIKPADSKAREPKRWGRWREEGGTFYLSDEKGRTYDYRLGSGNFFPAFPAEKGPALAGRFERTTSGGNAFLGGSTAILMKDAIEFASDGGFREGASMGALAPNVTAGRTSSASGRWRLSGATLELDYDDGNRKRLSFVFGARGTPPRPTLNMIFIGGDAYVKE